MPGRAGSELAALQKNYVCHAELGQVISDAAAYDATANNNHFGRRGRRLIHQLIFRFLKVDGWMLISAFVAVGWQHISGKRGPPTCVSNIANARPAFRCVEPGTDAFERRGDAVGTHIVESASDDLNAAG